MAFSPKRWIMFAFKVSRRCHLARRDRTDEHMRQIEARICTPHWHLVTRAFETVSLIFVQFIFLSNFLRSDKFVSCSVAGDEEEHSLCLNCETSKQSRRNFSRMSIITIRRLRKKFGTARDVGWCSQGRLLEFHQLMVGKDKVDGNQRFFDHLSSFCPVKTEDLPHCAPAQGCGYPNGAFCPRFYLRFRFYLKSTESSLFCINNPTKSDARIFPAP